MYILDLEQPVDAIEKSIDMAEELYHLGMEAMKSAFIISEEESRIFGNNNIVEIYKQTMEYGELAKELKGIREYIQQEINKAHSNEKKEIPPIIDKEFNW